MTNIQFEPFCSLYVNNYLSAADSKSLQLQPPLPCDRRRLSAQLFDLQRLRHSRNCFFARYFLLYLLGTLLVRNHIARGQNHHNHQLVITPNDIVGLHCRDYPMKWERPAAIFIWFVPGTRIFLAKAVYLEDPRARRQVQPIACKLNTENDIWC